MPRPKTVADDAVLDAAIRVVDRGGPGDLTLAAVAREVGLAPATLIQRFETKRGLLLAIARRAADGGGSSLREAAGRRRSPLRALVSGLVAMSSGVASPQTLANQLAFLQIDLSDPEFHRLALAQATAVRAEIRELLDAAVAAGEIRTDDTVALAQGVQTTYNGAMITWGIYRKGRLDRWLRRELDTLLAPYRAPMTVALFAGIRVRDLTAARAWYERLLGEPTFFPNATEVVWTLADDRSLYIEEDPRRAGGALITVVVDDLDARISQIGTRGLEPAHREMYSNGARKAIYRDDDGNEIGFGGMPRND